MGPRRPASDVRPRLSSLRSAGLRATSHISLIEKTLWMAMASCLPASARLFSVALRRAFVFRVLQLRCPDRVLCTRRGPAAVPKVFFHADECLQAGDKPPGYPEPAIGPVPRISPLPEFLYCLIARVRARKNRAQSWDLARLHAAVFFRLPRNFLCRAILSRGPRPPRHTYRRSPQSTCESFSPHLPAFR